ncbi:hypothetical protein ACFL4Q_03465 [candidate division KSB1 bacterium]
MNDFSLLSICLMAFLSVFVLLSVLALVMRVIIVLLPYREGEEKQMIPSGISGASITGGIDAAVVAAITTATASLYPGMKISNLKEI